MKQVLSVVLIMLALGSAGAMTVDEAKAFMTASRTRFLSAKSCHIEYTMTAMGVPTESRCWIRRDAKKGVSVLNESQTKPFGFPMPKMTQLVTEGKVYLFSAVTPDKALHLKFSDGQVPDEAFVNFLTELGAVEPVSDTKDSCVLKFKPMAAEFLQAGGQAMSAFGGAFPVPLGSVPESFLCTFRKPSGDISRIVAMDGQGQEVFNVFVSKLEFDAKINDSYFVLPKGCKVVDIKSAADAAKSLVGGLMPAAKPR